MNVRKKKSTFWNKLCFVCVFVISILLTRMYKQAKEFQSNKEVLEEKLFLLQEKNDTFKQALTPEKIIVSSFDPIIRMIEVRNFHGVILWTKNQKDSPKNFEYLSGEIDSANGFNFFGTPLGATGYELRGKQTTEGELKITHH